MRPLRLLQITDCHLGKNMGDQLLGLNTDESFVDILQFMQAEEKPDLIVMSGDISNDGSVESYQRFLDTTKQFFPNTPLAWLPGNHDDNASMAKVNELPIEHKYTLGDWNIIMLDSRIPMEEGGELGDIELARLDKELSQHSDRATIVFLHHQVVPVGSAWVDQYMLKDKDAFFKITDQYSNIKAVCWGHIHQEFYAKRRGVELLATPSTCVQFVPNRDIFQVDRVMPGYRLFELFDEGRFYSRVHRLPEKDYPIDYKSKGY